MFPRILLLVVAIASGASYAKDYSQWVTQVRAIENDRDGNFKLTFERTTADGKDQHIVLTDNDGIATLAVSQLMLVDRIKDIKDSKKGISMDSELSEVLRDGESRILTIQKDALRKIISSLESVANSGQGHLQLQGTKLTISDALKLAKELEGRFFVRMPWTLRDIENMGKAIQKLSGGGGPYSAEYTQNGRTETFSDVLLNDTNNPDQSFLSGAVKGGFFDPSWWVEGPGAFARSHIWVTGDVAQVSKKYSPNGSSGSSSPIMRGTHR